MVCLKMGFLGICGCFMLVVLNVLFVVISLAIVAAGVILKFFPGTLFSFLFDDVTTYLPFALPEDSGNLDLVPIVDSIGLALIVIGVILAGLSFLACCGACCRWRVFLVLFCVVMFLLIVAIATVGGMFLTRDSTMNDGIKRHLVRRVYKEYKGPTSSDAFSLTINALSYSMNCCAIAGPGDFNQDADWTRQTFKEQTFTLDTSPACCQREYIVTNRLDQCAVKPFTEDKVHMQGCYGQLMDLIQEQSRWGILALALILAFLTSEMIFAIIMIRDISHQSTRPI